MKAVRHLLEYGLVALTMRAARLLGIANFAKANWVGADIRGLDLRGSYMVQRTIADANYLYEFRTRSKYHNALYWLWWVTSDCGRSLFRWALFILFLILLFAFAYSRVGIDYGPYETAIAPLYFSVVTMTTLGYGDIVPIHPVARMFAILEALIGLLYPATLLARLVSLEIMYSKTPKDQSLPDDLERRKDL